MGAGEAGGLTHDRRTVDGVALGVALLPFAVGAIALLTRVGNDYWPASDWALTELSVRDIGHHEVFVGLYSRGNWHHPGPMLLYLLAPFYWLTGGASVGLLLGALAINAAAVAGMAALARRHGGTSLLLCTLVGCALLIRTLGAGFTSDPWVCYVTTLPFGLLLFQTWSLACGHAWTLPAATVVATFLIQTHVGFVVLAAPLLAWGAGWLVVHVIRSAEAPLRRQLVRPMLVSAALVALLWLPPLLDVWSPGSSNFHRTVRFFRHTKEKPHRLLDGWHIVTGQFAWPPEWLVRERVGFLTESPFLYRPAAPILLVPVVLAVWALWRNGATRKVGTRLAAAFGIGLVAGVVAVARTVGYVFDYRLFWTWALAMVGLVLVLWAGWQAAARRWAWCETRLLVPGAVAVLLAVTAVNVTTATRADTPSSTNDVLAAITPPVLEELRGHEGDVYVTEFFPYYPNSLMSTGLVLQLERHGQDIVVPASRAMAFAERFSDHDVPRQTRLVVAVNTQVESYRGNSDFRLLSEWSALPHDEYRRLSAELSRIEGLRAAGQIRPDTFTTRKAAILTELNAEPLAGAYSVAVFLIVLE